MDENTTPPNPPDEPIEPHEHHHHGPEWPRRQVYFVTVEWIDEPHRPTSPELIARAVRHAVEHEHNIPADAAPIHFSVRVKADDLAVEVEGTVEHHHHH